MARSSITKKKLGEENLEPLGGDLLHDPGRSTGLGLLGSVRGIA